MTIWILIIGLATLALGIFLLRSQKDIVNKPKIKNQIKEKGSSSLFDQIVNDDFESEE